VFHLADATTDGTVGPCGKSGEGSRIGTASGVTNHA
jgi:hypothetical protein